MLRTPRQNRLYQELITQLYKQKKIAIWDGEFESLGYPNPMQVFCRLLTRDTFRDIMKQLDLKYPKDDEGMALSSAVLSIEDFGSHIMFLEVLAMELEDG